jgi:hypothetical protein
MPTRFHGNQTIGLKVLRMGDTDRHTQTDDLISILSFLESRPVNSYEQLTGFPACVCICARACMHAHVCMCARVCMCVCGGGVLLTITKPAYYETWTW